MVFVHGNPDDGSDWMPLMTRVAPFAAVKFAPDLPGFGPGRQRPAGLHDRRIRPIPRWCDHHAAT